MGIGKNSGRLPSLSRFPPSTEAADAEATLAKTEAELAKARAEANSARGLVC